MLVRQIPVGIFLLARLLGAQAPSQNSVPAQTGAADKQVESKPQSPSTPSSRGASAASTQSSVPAHRETVVVTGSVLPVPLRESDRPINVYELPARVLLFGGINGILQLDSSVDLQQRAPGVQGDISIRGGSYGQTLVLVNGMRVNDAQSAHHYFDVPVPLDAIEQVEVLRGSGSTFYGSDAVAGVINIITRVDPGPELRFRSAIGNFGTNVQSGLFSFNAGRVSQQFSFERELSTGFRDDRDYRNLAGSSETHIQSSLGTTSIFLSGLDRPFGADQFYGNYNSWERTKTWFASLRQELGQNTDVNFSYRRHTDLYVLYRDRPSIYTNRHEDSTENATIRRHDQLTSGTTLFYGAEGLADSVDSTNLGVHQRKRGAVYGDLDVRTFKRFSFLVGAREEFFGRGQRFFSPSLSGAAWLHPKAKVRVAISRAFRLPNYTDLYYSDPANVGNPLLQPEQAASYEGGIDLYPTSRLKLSATVFERREKNGIDYVRSSPTEIWRAMNFARLNFTGVEASSELKLAHSQLVTVQYTGLQGAQDALNGLQSKYVFNYPTHEAIAGWQMLASNGLLARTRLGVLNRYERSPYTLWDVNLAWTKTRVRPYLQLTNLLNTSYQEVIGVPMQGRTVLVGIELCALCPRR